MWGQFAFASCFRFGRPGPHPFASSFSGHWKGRIWTANWRWRNPQRPGGGVLHCCGECANSDTECRCGVGIGKYVSPHRDVKEPVGPSSELGSGTFLSGLVSSYVILVWLSLCSDQRGVRRALVCHDLPIQRQSTPSLHPNSFLTPFSLVLTCSNLGVKGRCSRYCIWDMVRCRLLAIRGLGL